MTSTQFELIHCGIFDGYVLILQMRDCSIMNRLAVLMRLSTNATNQQFSWTTTRRRVFVWRTRSQSRLNGYICSSPWGWHLIHQTCSVAWYICLNILFWYVGHHLVFQNRYDVGISSTFGDFLKIVTSFLWCSKWLGKINFAGSFRLIAIAKILDGI